MLWIFILFSQESDSVVDMLADTAVMLDYTEDMAESTADMLG